MEDEPQELFLMPMSDRVCVVPDDGDEITPGGIIIPENARERADKGRVVAVGPGGKNERTGAYIPIGVEVGDEVYFTKYGGTEISHQGDDFLVLRQHDLLAVQEAVEA